MVLRALCRQDCGPKLGSSYHAFRGLFRTSKGWSLRLRRLKLTLIGDLRDTIQPLTTALAKQDGRHPAYQPRRLSPLRRLNLTHRQTLVPSGGLLPRIKSAPRLDRQCCAANAPA